MQLNETDPTREPLLAICLFAAFADGDKSDDRTDDKVTGVIVGLSAKGSKGKADASGFIRTV